MFGFLILLFSCYLILFTQSVIQAHAAVPSLGLEHIKLRIITVYILEHLLHRWVLTIETEAGGNIAG